jgi:methylmalonyl-CoA/ethylmalonyl-CoA epimerase
VGGPSLHHVGYGVRSISECIDRWYVDVSAVSVLGPFDDQIQAARVAFLELPGGGVTIELVEPLTTPSPVARFVEGGGGLHHLCFEVDDVDEQILAMKKQKALLIRSPAAAVAFGGRRIAWMMTREHLLTEYLERHSVPQW